MSRFNHLGKADSFALTEEIWTSIYSMRKTSPLLISLLDYEFNNYFVYTWQKTMTEKIGCRLTDDNN
jgi:hypothetical protein